MTNGPTCHRCNQTLAADAPSGICPACLFQQGLISNENSIAPTTVHSSESFHPHMDRLAESFPHLELISIMGQGGMGTVYKARQLKLDRLVALKIIRPEILGVAGFAERFEREAKALAKLNHPNIVGIYDFGSVQCDMDEGPSEIFFLLMEFVDGANLRELMLESIEPKEALAIVPQICEALQFAHDAGVVHRDVKPENILVNLSGCVKIADFGLAKVNNDGTSDPYLTRTHQVMGTPRYMAPEQLEQTRAVDHRADIYSLGVVFYEMLTGELPMGQFELPSEKASTDTRLDKIVMRSLAKEPERRYQSASQIKTDVDSIDNLKPPVVQQALANEKPNPGIMVDPHSLTNPSRAMLALGISTLLVSGIPILILFSSGFLTIATNGTQQDLGNRGMALITQTFSAESTSSGVHQPTFIVILIFCIPLVPGLMMGVFQTLVASYSLRRENILLCKAGGWVSLLPIYATWPIGIFVGINYLLVINRFDSKSWLLPPTKLENIPAKRNTLSKGAMIGIVISICLILTTVLPWLGVHIMGARIIAAGYEKTQGIIVLVAAIISLIGIVGTELMRIPSIYKNTIPLLSGFLALASSLHFVYAILQPATHTAAGDLGELMAATFSAYSMIGVYLSIVASLALISFGLIRFWRDTGA